MFIRVVVRFVKDDAGQDLVEYALLSGIVGVAGVLLFPVIADRMGTAYAGWVIDASAAWIPCDPGTCP